MEERGSNVWFVMATLVVTYFLYRITHIFVITTTHPCKPQSEFWYASHGGVTLSALFLFVFVLIGLWSIAEMLSAIKLEYEDKIATIIIAIITTIVVLCVALISRAQYEAYDLVYGDRTYENYHFDIYPFKYMTDVNVVREDGKYQWRQCTEKANNQIELPH